MTSAFDLCFLLMICLGLKRHKSKTHREVEVMLSDRHQRRHQRNYRRHQRDPSDHQPLDDDDDDDNNLYYHHHPRDESHRR